MADTKISALSAVSSVAGTNELAVNEAGTSKKATAAQLGTYLQTIGMPLVVALASDATANSTTTAAEITSMQATAVGAGTYVFQYFIRYQAAAITTGVKFSINHTGTVTAMVYNMSYVDAAATASTGAPSQAANASTAQVYGAYSARAKSATASVGPTLSVDTLNADMLMIIEGMMIVTVSGDLELWHASEVAAASTVKAGTSLILTRTA